MFLFIEDGHVFIPGPWLLLRVPGYHKNPLGSYATYHDDNENNSSTLAWRLLVYFFDASNARIRRETRSSATFYLNNFYEKPCSNWFDTNSSPMGFEFIFRVSHDQ